MVFNAMIKLSRNKLLSQAEGNIRKAYKAKRITVEGDNWIYKDRFGKTESYTLDNLAGLFWTLLNNELVSFNPQANFGLGNITVEDIKNIILKVRG